jgi:hypothetical protein
LNSPLDDIPSTFEVLGDAPALEPAWKIGGFDASTEAVEFEAGYHFGELVAS